AAESEYRQPLDIRRKIQPIHQKRIETRNSQTGDRIRNEGVDLMERQTGSCGRLDRNVFEELQCVLLENLGTFLPCMGLLVPFVRLACVAKVDASIGEKSEHARKLRIDSGRAYECVSLVDLVGRIGSCDRQYFY